MKKIAVLLIALGFTGCAHQSIHDYCVENQDHFSNYDECYSETAANRERKHAALAAMAQGFNQGYNQNRAISCTSTNYGYTTQTTCR